MARSVGTAPWSTRSPGWSLACWGSDPVSVNEEGTEAAAATAVVFTDTSVPEQATLTVDRPLLFAIRDRVSGAVLFLGRVTDLS